MKKKEACEKEILAYKKKKKQYNEKSRSLTNTTRGWGEYRTPFKFKIIVNEMDEVLRK